MLFAREYRDPGYGLITVTEVHMSPDLRIAKIYVSIMGNGEIKDRTLKLLEDRKPEIRTFVAQHVRLRFAPTVQFYLDETLDRVERINTLIKQIHEKDNGGGKNS